LDLQAAIGRAQLKKLPAFIQARKNNWEILRRGLDELDEFFDFMLPTHANAWSKSKSVAKPSGSSSALEPLNPSTFEWDFTGCSTSPSWFGFMLRVKTEAKFSARDLAAYLEENQIGSRMLFGGNLVRQPVFVQLREDRVGAFRVVSNLVGADEIMNKGIFLGTFPGLTVEMTKKELSTIKKYL
jgi:CDP-6-deoxy-D-xylo-4-hexulose-3-dehydrase